MSEFIPESEEDEGEGAFSDALLDEAKADGEAAEPQKPQAAAGAKKKAASGVAAEVGAKKSEPLRFNRAMLSRTVGGVFALAFVFFVAILPNLPKKKNAEADGAVKGAGKGWIPEMLAEETPIEKAGEQVTEPVSAGTDDDEMMARLREKMDGEPVLPTEAEEAARREQIRQEETRQTYRTGGGGGSWIDTRADPMQKAVVRMAWGEDGQTSGVGQNVQAMNAGGGIYDAISGRYLPYSQTAAGQADRAALIQSAMQQAGSQTAYSAQNGQEQKLQFLNQSAAGGGRARRHTLATLYTGTVVPLVLETGINTDLPGVVVGRVTKNVYSSFDGRHLIIPAGSRVFATYNSSVSYHQNRVQVVWNTLIRPDGLEVNLGNMNGVDAAGMSGYKGFYNGHPFEYAKALGLVAGFSILTTGFTVTTQNMANNLYAQNAVAATGQQLANISGALLDKALNIQPTITVKNGTEVDLITNLDLDLPPYEAVPEVSRKYVRR